MDNTTLCGLTTDSLWKLSKLSWVIFIFILHEMPVGVIGFDALLGGIKKIESIWEKYKIYMWWFRKCLGRFMNAYPCKHQKKIFPLTLSCLKLHHYSFLWSLRTTDWNITPGRGVTLGYHHSFEIWDFSWDFWDFENFWFFWEFEIFFPFFELYFFHYHLVSLYPTFTLQSPHCCPCPWVLFPPSLLPPSPLSCHLRADFIGDKFHLLLLHLHNKM